MRNLNCSSLLAGAIFFTSLTKLTTTSERVIFSIAVSSVVGREVSSVVGRAASSVLGRAVSSVAGRAVSPVSVSSVSVSSVAVSSVEGSVGSRPNGYRSWYVELSTRCFSSYSRQKVQWQGS